jgi:regulator-associated protein of mTOR
MSDERKQTPQRGSVRLSFKMDKKQKEFMQEERHQRKLEKGQDKEVVVDWRMKQRLKTVHVALIMCLNIGVDPPDVIKVHPCAKLECWIDPFSLPHQKALETIGAALKGQYERWQPRARYKQCLDPTVEDVKKTCCSLRRSAKKERILFHYNGHGVPRPTTNGEIWVFNKNFTQYIPLSLWDLYMWMDSPSIYVFDCNNAGLILKTFMQIIQQKDKEDKKNNLSSGSAGRHRENILLASCAANESLPLNPNFPADLFTACLTSPIKVALQWFCQNNRLVDGISVDMIDNLPGRVNDRRTPLGELNWIFTAVTDTIAWSVLPRDLFHKLFRQDLLVASLFRNFLLADRILRAASCTPMSYPKLPQTHNHPMWQAWDLAVDMCIAQLPTLIANPNAEYKYSTFFSSQLTDFQVWLDFGNRIRQPPKQLPILLQVLLSQVHRLRALTLLGRFLDMGSWAVNLALSVGIFPYVLKLLQSNSQELREILVFIWAKILALDRFCQVDLVKDNGHLYFINILANKNNDHKLRSMACFVLSVIVDRFAPGQRACLTSNSLINICISQLIAERDPLLRRWLLLLIAKLIEGLYEAQDQALSLGVHERVSRLLSDEIPEVRAAAVFCLASFVSLPSNNVITTLDTGGEAPPQPAPPVTQPTEKPEQRIAGEMAVGVALFKAILDGSPLVRRELVYALGVFLKSFADHISPDLLKQMVDEHTHRFSSSDGRNSSFTIPSGLSTLPPTSQTSKDKHQKRLTKNDSFDYTTNSTINKSPRDMKDRECGKVSFFTLDLCRIILLLSDDPMPMVSNNAQSIVNYLRNTYIGSEGSTLSTSVSSYSLLSVASSFTNPSSNSQVLDLRSRSHLREPSARRSRSPMRTSSPSSALPQNTKKFGVTGSARFFNMKKSVSEPDFSVVGDGSSTSLDRNDISYEDEVYASIPESRFYEWSCEYFTRPMLPENKDDDEYDAAIYEEEPVEEVSTLTPSMSQQLLQLQQEEEEEQDQQQQLQQTEDGSGSSSSGMVKILNSPRQNSNQARYMSPSQIKRQRRNEQLVRDANAMIKVVARRKLEDQIGFFGNDADIVREMRFHPFDPYLIVADESDGITVWNWIKGAKVNNFHISSSPLSQKTTHSIPSRITDFQILNDQSEHSILLVSTASGNLYMYKNYEKPDELYLVSAIRAEPDAVPMPQGPGILTEWQQDHGLLYVSGDVPHIKVWDIERELCIQTVTTDIEACVTSLACDHVGGFGLVAGCSDGSVLIYDRRQKSQHSIVTRMREHKNWVLNVCIQKVNTTQVISGSASGDIKFWDTRIDGASLKSFDAHKGSMTTLAVHDYAPVMACGSNDQFIKVFNTSGETLSMIYYHDGFLGQRIGPVSSLAFHPYRMCLAAGSTDSIISIYSGDTNIGTKTVTKYK